MLGAIACFGALDTTSKLIGATPVLLVLWVRYVVQTAITLGVLLPAHGRALFSTVQPGRQALRAGLLVTCNALAFLSLRHLHVAEFTAVVMLTPLVVTVVAAWGLREPVSGWRWACLLGGFAGTMLVMRPGTDLLHLAVLLPLLLVVANAGFQVLTSTMAAVERPGTIHFYSGLGGLVVTSLALPVVWQPPTPQVWGLMLLLGAFGAAGHFLLIVAYMRAPVAVLTPYLYLQILAAALGGWLVFGHVPDGWALVGIGLVGACGVFGTWLTGRERLQRGADAHASSIVAIAGADSR